MYATSSASLFRIHDDNFFLFLLSCKIVWLPDVFSNRIRTINSVRDERFGTVSLRQFWNHSDFYTLELVHRGPDGKESKFTLDGDAPKIWIARFKVNWADKRVLISGDVFPLGSYEWDRRRWLGRDGIVLTPIVEEPSQLR
jgi:hypothetical protein